MTSSTSVTRRPATSGPSASLQVPYSLASLRTKQRRAARSRALRHRRDRDAAELEPAEQLGVRGQQRRPSARRPARGGRGRTRRGTCRSTPSACPERSVNSPVSRQHASMSRARSESAAGTAELMAASVAGVLAATASTASPPTIFSQMSALAVATGSVNLGQGFPDADGPPSVIDAGGRGAARRAQPVRARSRRPRAAAGDRPAPAAALRPRPRPGHARSSSPPAAPRRSPPRCSGWSTRATRSSCSSPTTTPTSR